MFEEDDIHYYLALNCLSGDTYIFAGDENETLGTCQNSSGPGCMPWHVWQNIRRTGNDMQVYLSPGLDEQNVKKVKRFALTLGS